MTERSANWPKGGKGEGEEEMMRAKGKRRRKEKDKRKKHTALRNNSPSMTGRDGLSTRPCTSSTSNLLDPNIT